LQQLELALARAALDWQLPWPARASKLKLFVIVCYAQAKATASPKLPGQSNFSSPKHFVVMPRP
jgi:hypothetical protein